MPESKTRYVGLDVHKHYVMVGAVDRNQQVVLPPRKVTLLELEGWAQKYLQPSDEVVPSTGSGQAWKRPPTPGMCTISSNRWWDEWSSPTRPTSPGIAAAMVKTDKKDTMTPSTSLRAGLAKLLAVNLVPEVWVPPAHVRDLRALIAHRRRLISQQTQATQSWRTAPGKIGCKVCCIVTILYRQGARQACTTLTIEPGGSS